MSPGQQLQRLLAEIPACEGPEIFRLLPLAAALQSAVFARILALQHRSPLPDADYLPNVNQVAERLGISGIGAIPIVGEGLQSVSCHEQLNGTPWGSCPAGVRVPCGGMAICAGGVSSPRVWKRLGSAHAQFQIHGCKCAGGTMKHESSPEPHHGIDGPVEAFDVIADLAWLPAGTLLTVIGMAQIFGKSPNTIMRAVSEGRLPRPFRIFSENCWRAGEVDVFLQRRMLDAQRLPDDQAGDTCQDLARGRAKSLPKGTSPIRSEPHAGNT